MKKDEAILDEQLIEIFNRVLDSHPFIVSAGIFDTETKSYRNCWLHKEYYENKLTDIENKLEVFKYIPQNKIYKVIEKFVAIIEEYNRSKIYKKNNAKKLQNDSYRLIKKDIKIIEAYQEIIFDYTLANHNNTDSNFSILVQELDEVYWFNERLLDELKQKEFNILDPYRYGGTNMYDSTKKRLKYFFKQLAEEWRVNKLDAKQMIDIL